MPTGAGVHGGDEHEIRRKLRGVRRSTDGDAAFFERLPQRFQTAAVKFGKFVEEEDAVVGEGDFAGLRDAAAADHAGITDGVMGRAERPRGEERFSGRHLAHGRVDAGRFETFFRRERRQNRGQPAREHCFSGAGAAQHDDVVPAGGGNRECPLGELLAAHVAEVHVVLVEPGLDLFDARCHRIDIDRSGHDADGLGQRRDSIDLDFADYGGLAGVGCRDDHLRDATASGLHGHGEGAADGSHTAIQCKFTHGAERVQLVRRELAGSDEQPEGDGQVEGAGAFGEIGGSQVDDGAAGGAEIAEVSESPFDPVNAFANGEFGEPDEYGFGVARRRVNLHLHGKGVDPEEGESSKLG